MRLPMGSNCTPPVHPYSNDGTQQYPGYNFDILFDSAYDLTKSRSPRSLTKSVADSPQRYCEQPMFSPDSSH